MRHVPWAMACGTGAFAALSAMPAAAAPRTGAPGPLKLNPAVGVPRAATPASGSPLPLGVDENAEDPANAEALYTPLSQRGFHPMSVFAESRTPRAPDPGKRRKPARRSKRKRNTDHRFLPLPHVSSQPATGLTLGGSLNYSYRKAGEQFNRAYVLAWSRVSTRGVQDHIFQGRLRDLLGKGEVFQFGFWISLDPVFPFFGINNHESQAGTEIAGPYNRMRMDNYGGWFTYEHPLWRLYRHNRPVGVLRQYSGLFYYIDVLRGYPGSRLVETNPELIGTDRRGMLRGGLTWDSRDNDWSPREGSLVDLTFDAAGPYTGSTSGWGRAHFTARNFWPLGHTGFVFAHRVTLDALWGQPPLMALGEFGGLFPMDAYGGAFVGRGFGRRRFAGNIKATTSAEIRFVPVELPLGRHRLAVGFEGFFEMGLVSTRVADLFKYWYPSGGPGLLFIWDRFVVFRIESAHSSEGSAVYLQSDHAF